MTLIVLTLATFATLALDQAAKALVISHLAEGQRVLLLPFASLFRVTHRGGSWLPVSRPAAALAWLALAAGFAGLAFVSPPFAAVGLGLALGGAAGNLADRLARGGVVDFIAIGRWPTFNLADAALLAGVVLVAAQALGAWARA